MPELSHLPGAPADYPRVALAPGGSGQLFRVVDGWLTVQVYRGGRLARLGHNHVLEAPIYGTFRVDGEAVTADLYARPAELLVDREETRRALGPDFANSDPDAEDIEGTRGNLLSKKVLNPNAYPFIRATIDDERDAGGAVAAVIDLAGGTAEVAIEVEAVEAAPCEPGYRGTFRLSHSDLGLTPFSILGGAVAVADAFDVTFFIGGQPIGDCRLSGPP
ncbi:MAG: hypothetical protein AAGA23_10280 [Pseudomonadota bacterium]